VFYCELFYIAPLIQRYAQLCARYRFSLLLQIVIVYRTVDSIVF